MKAIDAHLHAMASARSAHSIRTVIGWQYPLPERSFARYLDEQKELRRKRAREFLKRVGQRAAAEAAFA